MSKKYTYDNGHFRNPSFAKHLRVAKRKKVEDRRLIALLAEVFVALLGGDERPEFIEIDYRLPAAQKSGHSSSIQSNPATSCWPWTYNVQFILCVVKVPHSNLSARLVSYTC